MQADTMLRIIAGLVIVVGATGCGDSSDENPGNNSELPTSNIATIDEGNGVFASQINATASDEWVYMDLATREQVDAGADPTNSDAWDIAFRRSNIKVNGGFSGGAGVEVTVITTDDFASVTTAPVTLYSADRVKEGVNPDQPDFVRDDNTDFVFGRDHALSPSGWFNYNPTTHVLTAAQVVYAVRDRNGEYYKVRFLDYYDQAGTSGFPTIRYARIAPPDPMTSGIEVDASDRQTPIYFKLETKSVVQVSDPSTSTDWDIRILRTSFATNGGESGSGLAGAQWGEQTAYMATFFSEIAASTIGFDTDKRVPPPGPPVPPEQWVPGNVTLGEWFNYDPAVMVASPKEGFFLIRAADGVSFYKLKIFVYSDGVYRLDVAPLARNPAPRTITVQSTDAEAWTYVSLRLGTETSSAGGDWDVAFSRTRVRTNSGTSGSGEAGAVDLGLSDFDAVTEAPATGYVADEMMTQGRPGETEYSGNPSLGDWFDYDSSSNTVTPKATIYAVRLVDGTFAKLRVDDYSDGVITITYAYAGVVGASFQ